MLVRKLYFLKNLIKSQWDSKEKIEKFQLKRLRWMINHCYNNIRFYRKFWSLNNAPRTIKKIEDIEKFPVINRKIVMENYPEFIIETPKKKIFDENLYYTGLTSGSSSGHSFRILINEKTWDLYESIYLRGLISTGYNPFNKTTYYWYNKYDKWYHHMGIMKKDFILPSIPFEEQIKNIELFNNKFLHYFPSILYMLTKIKPQFINKPKAIITHAEVISEKMRKRIENAFDSKVYDQYGATEFNEIGWECEEHFGYHINSEAMIVEVLKDKNNVYDEMGDIVITDLWNSSFPLIRYSIGDVGSITNEKCSCGRGLPILKGVEGRKTDIFKVNNKIITPKVIIDAFDDLPLLKFNLNKLNGGKYLINFIPLKNQIKEKQLHCMLNKKFSALFGEDANLKVKFRETPILKRGKFKMVNNITKEGMDGIIRLDPFSKKT